MLGMYDALFVQLAQELDLPLLRAANEALTCESGATVIETA
jgi:predicted nucleic acid-binding protein